MRLLTNPHRPVQLLIAGKAHPADEPGQAMIRQWTDFIRRRPEVRPHAVFLSDYDMLLTEQMVHGVDVWINNPRRPWEACGTSGMKVLVNGGINLSELDGWWAEAYELVLVGPMWQRAAVMIRSPMLPRPKRSTRNWSRRLSRSSTTATHADFLSDGFRTCVRAWHA